MSDFSSFIDKAQSEKTLLFEIDLPEEYAFWLAFEAGIWMYKITNVVEDATFNFQNGAFCYGAFQGSGTETLGTEDKTIIVGSLEVDNTRYLQVTSLANLRTQNQSWFYDAPILYVHFDGFDPPDVFDDIILGITQGYSNRDIYLDNNYYGARVKAAPRISKSKDLNYFGVIKFEGGTVGLHNNDGHFDDLVTQNLYGWPARVKLGGDDLALSAYSTIFTGFVENWNADSDTFNVEIQDKRKKLSREIPINFFTATANSNINADNIDKPIPMAYGTIRKAPVVCTNEDETPTASHYDFKICDTTNHAISSIDTVYVDGVSAAIHSPSTGSATFSLTAGVYNAGDPVTCSFVGYVSSGTVICNSLDVIVDIFRDYLDIEYNTDNYDTTEWASAESDVYNIGLWLDEVTDITSVIEKISTSNMGNLIITGAGKYTFRVPDRTADSSLTIDRDEELTQPSADYSSEEFLTSVVINYYEDQGAGEYRSRINVSEEDDRYDDYRTYRQKSFDTVLYEASAASALSTRLLEYFDKIRPTHSVTVKLQAASLELMDVFAADIDRMNAIWMGPWQCELLGIDYDLDNFEITLTGQAIQAHCRSQWAADSITFPASLGGGDAGTWDPGWTKAQKVYARRHWAYWADDNGFIDSTDRESENVTWWRSDTG